MQRQACYARGGTVVIRVPEVVVERVAAVRGSGEGLAALAERAARRAATGRGEIGAVVAATFSNPDRFPSLAVRVASALGLSSATPAFDLQMACSGYPYALYVAGRLATDIGRPVLVIDGDVQSPLVDPSDHATGSIFSDAATATVISASPGSSARSQFAFLSKFDDKALACPASGPIRMDGFAVFSFVATEVSAFLKGFLAESGAAPDIFAPHQANPYMVRQLAKSLGLSDRLVAIDESWKNPGSCSVAMALACGGRPGATALVVGFGAGYSAAAGVVRISSAFNGGVE